MRSILTGLIFVLLWGHPSAFGAEAQTLKYLVLADTVEPLMLASEDQPMRGGIVTDVLLAVFAQSGHTIDPLIVPWQRAAAEQKARDNWIMYGMRSACDPGEGCAVSTEPIVDFDHVIVSLADVPLNVRAHHDLFGKRLILVENFHYPGLDRFLMTPVDTAGDGSIVDIRAFSPEGALRMLAHRRGEAFVDWDVRVLYNLEGAGLSRDEVHISDASSLVPKQKIHFFYSDKLPHAVRDLIDRKLSEMRANGDLQRIVAHYR